MFVSTKETEDSNATHQNQIHDSWVLPTSAEILLRNGVAAGFICIGIDIDRN
jgi:hypothetical protein